MLQASVYGLRTASLHYERAGDSESIIVDASVLKDRTFDEYVLSVINIHAGKTDKQLCEMLGMAYTGNKAQWVSITYKLLGLRGEHAQEFEKAGISVRTIRVKPHGGVKESLSLDTFDFIELLEEEDWEHSDLFTVGCNGQRKVQR